MFFAWSQCQGSHDMVKNLDLPEYELPQSYFSTSDRSSSSIHAFRLLHATRSSSFTEEGSVRDLPFREQKIKGLAMRLVTGNTAAATIAIFELLNIQHRTIYVGCGGMDHIKGDSIARTSLMEN